MGLDTQLIDHEAYFFIEIDDQVADCRDWSKRAICPLGPNRPSSMKGRIADAMALRDNRSRHRELDQGEMNAASGG
jgi:hypothetical protein